MPEKVSGLLFPMQAFVWDSFQSSFFFSLSPKKVLVKICGQSAAGQAAKMAKRAASAEAALEGRLLARWKSLHKFETGKLAKYVIGGGGA